MGERLTLGAVRAKHKPILEKLYNALKENPPRPLRRNELFDQLETSNTSFCRHIEDLETDGFIMRFVIEGKTYYTLGEWGRVVLNADNVRPEFFFAYMGAWEMVYEQSR